jgi:hypothetical protein
MLSLSCGCPAALSVSITELSAVSCSRAHASSHGQRCQSVRAIMAEPCSPSDCPYCCCCSGRRCTRLLSWLWLLACCLLLSAAPQWNHGLLWSWNVCAVPAAGRCLSTLPPAPRPLSSRAACCSIQCGASDLNLNLSARLLAEPLRRPAQDSVSVAVSLTGQPAEALTPTSLVSAACCL